MINELQVMEEERITSELHIKSIIISHLVNKSLIQLRIILSSFQEKLKIKLELPKIYILRHFIIFKFYELEKQYHALSTQGFS